MNNPSEHHEQIEHRTVRVLMPVLHYYPVIGGLENWTQNIAEGIVLRRGSLQGPEPAHQGQSKAGQAEIFVVTARVGDQAKYEIKNGVKIFRTSLFKLKDLSYSSPFFILGALPLIFLKSFSLILSRKINLLHCQGFLGACLGYCLSKITGVPYIVTVQRLEEGKFVKKIAYRSARLCIAASSAIKDYFEDIGCKNIEVIPNGVDLKRFENLKRQEKAGFVIATVARMEKVKGIKYLIEAINILCSNVRMFEGSMDDNSNNSNISNNPNNPNIKLLIIGDGSERNNLENLSARLGLEEKIKFVGQIPPEGIPEYLAMADCFVMPSLKEGFGIAILESMAAGVPVIATKVGGILDIIDDGKTGLLIEPGNSQAIARALLRVYSNRELSRDLVRNARNNLKKYDWHNIAKKVYENYLSYGNISA